MCSVILWADNVCPIASEWLGSFARGDLHDDRRKGDDERDVTVVLDLEVGYVVQLC